MSDPRVPATVGYAAAPMPAENRDGGTDVWHIVHLSSAWLLTVASLGYFLPWAIAATRRKSNTLPIALVNLLLGWTLVGWIVALVMACGAEQRAAAAQIVHVNVQQNSHFGGPGPYPAQPPYGQVAAYGPAPVEAPSPPPPYVPPTEEIAPPRAH